jgi:S1-C subfamily serine protease
MPKSAAAYLCLLPSIAAMALVGQTSQPRPERQLTVAEIVRQTSNAVVQVVVSDEADNELAFGSGFIVSPDGRSSRITTSLRVRTRQ